MNTLVIYDSKFGNTERIARQLAETLGEFGEARAVRVTEIPADIPKEINLLVVGSPTQAWNATPDLKSFLTHLEGKKLENFQFAEFDTRFDKPRWLTGSAAGAMRKQLIRLGARTFVPPESFFVKATEGPLADGELEHAARWARELHERFEAERKFSSAFAAAQPV